VAGEVAPRREGEEAQEGGRGAAAAALAAVVFAARVLLVPHKHFKIVSVLTRHVHPLVDVVATHACSYPTPCCSATRGQRRHGPRTPALR